MFTWLAPSGASNENVHSSNFLLPTIKLFKIIIIIEPLLRMNISLSARILVVSGPKVYFSDKLTTRILATQTNV